MNKYSCIIVTHFIINAIVNADNMMILMWVLGTQSLLTLYDIHKMITVFFLDVIKWLISNLKEKTFADILY